MPPIYQLARGNISLISLFLSLYFLYAKYFFISYDAPVHFRDQVVFRINIYFNPQVTLGIFIFYRELLCHIFFLLRPEASMTRLGIHLIRMEPSCSMTKSLKNRLRLAHASSQLVHIVLGSIYGLLVIMKQFLLLHLRWYNRFFEKNWR